MAKRTRCIFLGLDAMVPNMVEKFMAEGVMPNFMRLLKTGVFTRIRPVIPAQTPSNWTTLATGATPGTHGIVVWGSHLPGEVVTEEHREEAFSSGLCRAEYLWEAAARAEMRSVVMNYAGYPPTCSKAVHIDRLFKPARSFYDLSEATVYHNCPEINTSDPIELKAAEGWKALPASARPPLEFSVHVAPATKGSGPEYHGLVCASKEGYDTVFIATEKDASKGVARLSAGQWSDWVRARFETADQGRAEGAFLFKLLELAPDGNRLRLYRSDAFPTDGRFCSRGALGRKLVKKLGPYLHSGHTVDLHCRGWIDWQTADEFMAREAAWWANAANIAMADTRSMLLVLHWHILDCIGHTFVQKVDPTGSKYEAAKAEAAWETIRGYYRAADRFVGEFIKLFDDGKTAFAVVSDHGMPANKKAVSLINLFRRLGYVVTDATGKKVDWAKSKLYIDQNHIWINLAGRNQNGIVPPGECAALCSRIINEMRDVKDPDSGEHVFGFVFSRDDAAMVGMWGDYVGDVVFCYAGGYRWAGPEVLQMGEERVVFPCGGGNHGPMMPTYETEATSVMGGLLLSGPGIRAGVKIPRAEQFGISTCDLAPTLSHLLGIGAPAQCEGRILGELLKGVYSERPVRKLESLARPILHRPTVKPKAVTLQGDVTDET